MLSIRESSAFKRDIKRLKRGNFDLSKLAAIIIRLANKEKLEERHSDHLLSGNWRGYRECHIKPDGLLIYRIEGDELQLARTGSHSELF